MLMLFHHCQRTCLLLAWSLLLIGSFLGAVAFAEQLTLIEETGPHDERALEGLQFSVKSGETGSDQIKNLIPLPSALQLNWSSLHPFVLKTHRLSFTQFLPRTSIPLFIVLSCWLI
jgi:hypothetical protein